MSKVICDVCGTAYPETASQCPICGCAKPEDAVGFDFDNEGQASPERTQAKGGHFSKANVKKRSAAAGAAAAAAAARDQGKPAQPRKKKKKSSKKRNNSNTALVIVLIVLLVAIAAVLLYMYFTYFAPQAAKKDDTQPVQTTTQGTETQQPTTTVPQQTTEADLSCTALELSEDSIMFNTIGSSWLLNAIPTPVDTTDTVSFRSGDETVATVAADGRVTAVGAGETVIIVTCGDVSIWCEVTCEIPEETTAPQQTTDPEETTEPETVYEFKFNNRYHGKVKNYDCEATFKSAGETWIAYKGEIDMADITWSVGNTSVITVKDGKVRAVGEGVTILYAEYNGKTYTCRITCDFG